MTPVLALVEKFDPGWLSYSPVSTAAVKVSTWPGEAQNVAAELTWLPLSPVVAVNAAEVVDCVRATSEHAAHPQGGERADESSRRAPHHGASVRHEKPNVADLPAAAGSSCTERLKRKPRVFLGVRGVPGGTGPSRSWSARRRSRPGCR